MITEKIDLNNLDKTTWKSFSFEKIAQKISKTVQPSEAEVDVYVGLEHLNSSDIHIRRKGSPSDVKGGKLKCSPGDIIFGKRRAYQRKAAIVDFEGICSAHAFVFRANPEVIDPDLFPFFLHSDQFMHRMVDISVGGLSPTINWGDLKHQEFLLPPKDQQAQLTELLWTMDEVIEKELKLLETLNINYEVENNNIFTVKQNDWNAVPLKSISKINKKSLTSKTENDYQFKYLDIASIIEPKKIGRLSTISYGESPSRARRVVFDNSIVLSLVRPYQKSFVYVEKGEGIIASTGTGVVEVNEGIEPKFIFHQFFSKRFLHFCENRMTGTNYPAITPKDLETFKVFLPNDTRLIKVLTEKLETLDKTKIFTEQSIESSKSLQKSLINQVF